MVFCSSSICHVEARSMIRVMHQSLNDCVLSLWRNGVAKLAMDRTRPAQLIFAVTALSCYSENELSWSGPSHGVLLLHDNVPIDKCKIVQAAIRQAGFIESNHPVYSPDIALTNSHPLSNLKKFVRGMNFSSDDEAVTTVEDYLTDLNSESFCTGIQSLHDHWQRAVASEGQYI